MQELIRIFGRLKDRFFPPRYPEYDDYELSPVDYGAAPDNLRRLKIAGFLILLSSVPFWIYVAMLRDSEMIRRQTEGAKNYAGFEEVRKQEAQPGSIDELQQWMNTVEKEVRMTGGDSRALNYLKQTDAVRGPLRTPPTNRRSPRQINPLGYSQPYAVDVASNSSDPFSGADARREQEKELQKEKERELAAQKEAEEKERVEKLEEERRIARAEYSQSIGYSISDPSMGSAGSAAPKGTATSSNSSETRASPYAPRSVQPVELSPRSLDPY